MGMIELVTCLIITSCVLTAYVWEVATEIGWYGMSKGYDAVNRWKYNPSERFPYWGVVLRYFSFPLAMVAMLVSFFFAFSSCGFAIHVGVITSPFVVAGCLLVMGVIVLIAEAPNIVMSPRDESRPWVCPFWKVMASSCFWGALFTTLAGLFMTI